MTYDEIREKINTHPNEAPHIRGINTESSMEGHGKIHFDIAFALNDAENRESLVNVEIQNYIANGSVIGYRIIYYVGRIISDQKNVDFHRTDYHLMKHTYTI